MAVATITGQELREKLVEYGDWVSIGAVTAGGTSSQLIDTLRLSGVNLSSALFDGAIVRITSGTRDGEQSFVDYLDQDTGTLYLTPALTGALTAADTYEIWRRGINPDIVDRLRDDCLQKFCSQWRVVALSLIADGDMESAGVGSWTVAAGATRTKGYSTFPYAHSRRELSVVHTTASTDYVASDPLDVQPGERFFLQVPVRAYVTATPASPATASIVVRDLSNGANISLSGLKTTSVGRGPGWISLLFTIPADCYRIEFRLSSATTSSTTVWGAINCHKLDKSRVSLPDRITTRKRVGTFYTTSQVNSTISEMSDSAFKLTPYLATERIQMGGQVECWFRPSLSNLPVFFYERGYFDRLSTNYLTVAQRIVGDAAATDCQVEYAVATIASRLAEYMLNREGGDGWRDEWIRAEASRNYWEQEMGPEPQFVHEAESPPFIPYFEV